MSRTVSGLDEEEIDLFDSDIQRHLLEVANIRMLFMVGVRDAQVREFQWTTCKIEKRRSQTTRRKSDFPLWRFPAPRGHHESPNNFGVPDSEYRIGTARHRRREDIDRKQR